MGSERILAPVLERLQAGLCKAWGGKHPKAEVSIFRCTVQMHRAAEEFITCPRRWMVGIFLRREDLWERQREQCWGVLATWVSPVLLMSVSGHGTTEEEEEEEP